jgi:hypothetical protein
VGTPLDSRTATVIAATAAWAIACGAPAESPTSPAPDQNMVAIISHNTIHGRYHEEERIWRIPGTDVSRTQHSRDGRVVLDIGVAADGTRVTVLHDSGTYRLEPPIPCPDRDKCGPGASPEPDVFTSDGVRRSIADGSMAVVASNVETDGRPAEHLRGRSLDISLTGTVDMWLDPSTSLPFRYRVSDSSTERDATVTYLPRTAENLSQLVVPIPPEFTEAQPVEDEIIEVPSRPPGG